ncbi:MAG: response regulator, partial [Lachnospiraceae bacterium]|nr:response regulator [Lachnospiraceae bacterium]
MAVMLAAMYGFSLMGQYRWFRLKRRTLAGMLLVWLSISVLGYFCNEVLAEYGFNGFRGGSLVKMCVSMTDIAVSALILYLLFNHTPDGLKASFPIGIGYTKAYIKDLLLQNNLRKTKLSRKVTAIMIAVVIMLGVFSSVFAPLIISEMTAMRDRKMPPELVEKHMDETELADEEEVHSFMRSAYGNAFTIKILLMNLCMGAPLAGIANFYIKQRVGAPIGRLSSYMTGFMDASDENMESCVKNIRDSKLRTRDEITDLYHATAIMMEDVTGYIEKLKTEQKLEEDLRVAKAASEAKSAFLSNMSHEIRTPINAVLGMDEMILREAEDKEILRYAADIKNAGNTLLSLVNDILDFSKIEAGKMDILPVQYQLGSTINDLVNMLSQKAEEKGLELILDIDPGLPTGLYGDEIRIKQCVTNILTNAVKYTEKGSVTLKMGFEQLDADEISLFVSVKDTGIGIKEEEIDKLFSPFERIEEIRNRTIEGTGLGMSIVKKLLAMMDTKMNVKSVYGEGSEFSFAVKQKVTDATPIGDFAETYRKAVDSMERYRESFRAPDACVLIVDDTRMNLTVIRSLLKSTQLAVDTAESGRETLKMVCEKKYDCIFLDHRMPEMDGIETFEAMKTLKGNLNTGTPCIALTANAVAGAREEYLSRGFIDYLSKPVDPRKLEKMLIKYLPEEKVIKTERTDAEAPVEEDADEIPLISGL